MRLRTRLILLIAVAALGPLGVLGIGATGVASRLLGDTISDRQRRTSDGLALYVDTWLSLQLRLITQQARTFRLGELDDPSLVSFLRLVYTQIPEANITSLVNRAGVDRVGERDVRLLHQARATRACPRGGCRSRASASRSFESASRR